MQPTSYGWSSKRHAGKSFGQWMCFLHLVSAGSRKVISAETHLQSTILNYFLVCTIGPKSVRTAHTVSEEVQRSQPCNHLKERRCLETLVRLGMHTAIPGTFHYTCSRSHIAGVESWHSPAVAGWEEVFEPWWYCWYLQIHRCRSSLLYIFWYILNHYVWSPFHQCNCSLYLTGIVRSFFLLGTCNNTRRWCYSQ